MPIKRALNKTFFRAWSPEMAYVLGFIFADGSITMSVRGAYYLDIQIKDKDLLERIRFSLGSNHKITKRVHKKDKSVFYRLQIGSKELCEDISKLGAVPQKTKRMRLPSMPRKYLNDFVRGYFDGDGNVWCGFIHKNRKTKTQTLQAFFTSGSKEFLLDLHKALQEFGLRGGGWYAPKGGHRLIYSVSDAILLYRLMYKGECSLFLPRKRVVFEKYIR